MRKWMTIIMLLGLWLKGYGQTADREFIKTWLQLFDSTSTVTNDEFYVVDGRPYAANDIRLEQHLAQIPVNMILYIEKKRPSSATNYRVEYSRRKEVIMVTTVQYQQRDVREDSLEAAKNMFRISKPTTTQQGSGYTQTPALYIDGKVIDARSAQKLVLQLTPYAIYAVHRITGPASVAIWGQNAENGVVRIWTRKFVLGK